MENQPLFSALVANYNNGRYIAECLDSILKQEYSHIEIIIVDDGSTDNSLTIIEPYLQKHKHINLFKNEENKGVGYTKKRCIDESKGEILGFVDPDDIISENAVSLMVEKHQEYINTSLLYSDYYECDERLKIADEYKSAQVKNREYNFFNDKGYIGPFSTFKKEAYHKTCGLNSYLKRAIDQDLYLKLYDVGDCIHIPSSLYYYRMHKSGIATYAQSDLAYYWFWIVKILRAQEKGINLEQSFEETFIRKKRIRFWIKIDLFLRRTWLFKIVRKLSKT